MPRRPRTLTLIATLLGALVVATAPTAAGGATPAPPDWTTGKIGEYRLRDRPDAPAGTCRYEDGPGNDLVGIASRAPKVFARAGRTSQVVSLRLVVERWEDGWVVWRTSRWVRRTATPTKPAAFTAPSKAFTVDREDLLSQYRPRLDVHWLGANDRIVGKARLWPDHFVLSDPPNDPVSIANTWCGETTG
jgi:hypothetical protein